MTARAVRMSPRAERWFLNAISDIAEVNPSAAIAVMERFREMADKLSLFPEMSVAGLVPGTRRVYVRPFLVTIRVRPDLIEIVAIRHARQQDARAPRIE